MKNPIYKPKGATQRKSITSHGYVVVRLPNHPKAFGSGYVYEHRLVMEGVIGRLLEHHEIVHHIDGNKRNNSPDNLALVGSIANHKAEHRHPGSSLRMPGENNPVIKCACGCGELFLKYDGSGRPRRYCIASHGMRKTVAQIAPDRTIVNVFPGVRAAGKATGIDPSTIGETCRGQRKRAGGFMWEYVDNSQESL